MNELLNESFITDLCDDDLVDTPDTQPPAKVTSISQSRLRANRENAKLSSGAKTPAGKDVVSQNSVKHGLSGSKFRVLATEQQSDFDELLNKLLASYAPADDAESELVVSMAQTLWLARRAACCQNRCVEALESGDAEAAKTARLDLALYLRYQTTHERAHSRYAADLRKLQSERRKTELGFASQKAKEADRARKQELHEARVANLKARTDHQAMKNRSLSYIMTREDEAFERERRSKESSRKLQEQQWAKWEQERLKKQNERQSKP